MRGFLERRRYRIRRQEVFGANKYFSEIESNETLKGSLFDNDAPIEERTYTYSTGSVYEGQWKGGMRHGHGTMKWEDGSASYIGQW